MGRRCRSTATAAARHAGRVNFGPTVRRSYVLVSEARSFHDLLVGQPTLLRLLPSIGFDAETGMDFVCLGGALLSFVAMVTRDQRNSVVFGVLWMFYLSLFHVRITACSRHSKLN